LTNIEPAISELAEEELLFSEFFDGVAELGNIGVQGCLGVEFGDAELAFAPRARNLTRSRVSI
jgi:hypothetical protein